MRFNPRRCRECRRAFVPKRFDQDFCGRAYRRAWHSWREARGASAVELLVKWRRGRLPGSFAKLTAFADDLISEIRAREKARAEASEPGERTDVAAISTPVHGRRSAAFLPVAPEQEAQDR